MKRVLVIVHSDLVPPDKVNPKEEGFDYRPWITEYDVISNLKKIGHQVEVVGVGRDDHNIVHCWVAGWTAPRSEEGIRAVELSTVWRRHVAHVVLRSDVRRALVKVNTAYSMLLVRIRGRRSA